MLKEAFKKKIKQDLEKFNRQQKIHFAWCCGVRALPILGYRGHFDFWRDVDRQKYLYAVFYALDYAAVASATAAPYGAARFAATAVITAADAASRATTPADAARFATATAAYAADAAAAADTYAIAVADAKAAAADTTAAAVAAAKMDINLESILLSDLNSIRKGGEEGGHKSADLGFCWPYGDPYRSSVFSVGTLSLSDRL